MSRTKKQFTQYEKDLLSDTKLTAKELMLLLGVKTEKTISRWRKMCNVNVPLGSKKGKAKPTRYRRKTTKCCICNKEFEHILSKKRKVCSRECLNVYNKSVDRSYMQTEEYRQTKRKDDTPAYKKYKHRVHNLSEKVYQENIDLINPDRYPRTLAGVDGGYQLDHIIPVRFGFDNNIPEYEIARLDNLRMLPWKKNLERNRLKS